MISLFELCDEKERDRERSGFTLDPFLWPHFSKENEPLPRMTSRDSDPKSNIVLHQLKSKEIYFYLGYHKQK